MQSAVPNRHGLAEASAGGDHGNSPGRFDFPGIEQGEVLLIKQRDAIGIGLQVVDQGNLRQTEQRNNFV